jgi:hypothetical protein
MVMLLQDAALRLPFAEALSVAVIVGELQVIEGLAIDDC